LPISNFSHDRLTALLDYVESRNHWNGPGRDLGRQTFQQNLSQPGFDPENNCWLLEDGGKVKGFCLVNREPPINRAVLQMDVDPSFAGSTEEKELLRLAVDSCSRWGAQVAHICQSADSPRNALLGSLGFSHVRTYTVMDWQGETLPDVPAAQGFQVTPFSEGDHALLTQVQNDAFGGSWGFCPNTVDQIKYRIAMADTSTGGILFLRNGEKTAGHCWTCISPIPAGIRGAIGMIGVVPEYRGQGISSSILSAGMRYLKSIDVQEIGLEVDSSNTPAIRLYTSVGFRKVADLHWFELELSRFDNSR
jgi:mycothiol synthase